MHTCRVSNYLISAAFTRTLAGSLIQAAVHVPSAFTRPAGRPAGDTRQELEDEPGQRSKLTVFRAAACVDFWALNVSYRISRSQRWRVIVSANSAMRVRSLASD